MTNRVTKTQMHRALNLLNRTFNYPEEPYSEPKVKGDMWVANECFVLDGAYGGWKVCKQGPNGGQRDLTPRGTKRETFEHIHSLIKGAEMMNQEILKNPKQWV